MERKIIETEYFTKEISRFFKKNQLLEEDFSTFKQELVKNPEQGDRVPGAGGVRKTRIKSSSKGKSGGFRICYYYKQINGTIFLLVIYPKNTQENLTAAETKELKALAAILKGNKK